MAIAGPLTRHRDELTGQGWTVRLIPGGDHLGAMQPAAVLPVLTPWLRDHATG